MACYSGPNPVDKNDPSGRRRMAIWKWAKANAIDHGLPFAEVHKLINDHFFGGTAKPEWIDDILSGRKTPYRQLAQAAWKAQYNRRQIVQQAEALTREQRLSPIGRALIKGSELPRVFEVLGHFATPPFSHSGDLLLRPASWGVFFRGLKNTWGKALSPAETERLLESVRREPLYDLALQSGLIMGPRRDISGIIDPTRKGSASERAFEILGATRFDLWNRAMQQYKIRPDTPQSVALDYGRNFADWANHATGAAKGGIAKLGPHVLFGPALTQSKLARIAVDPIKTIWTGAKVSGVAKIFGHWPEATPGEKAVALRRLSGLAQYVGTGFGFLAVNQGYLMATGQKQNINWQDPTKSDWMKFKSGSMEFGLPGLHSELRTLGELLAVTYMDSKATNPRHESEHRLWGNIIMDYLSGKLSPAISAGMEAVQGQDVFGRPLPWGHGKQPKSMPRIDWWDYALSHGPIPLGGPIRYVYDKWRDQGASAVDAMAVIKSLIMAAAGFSGLHASPDYAAAKEAAKRNQAARSLQHR